MDCSQTVQCEDSHEWIRDTIDLAREGEERIFYQKSTTDSEIQEAMEDNTGGMQREPSTSESETRNDLDNPTSRERLMVQLDLACLSYLTMQRHRLQNYMDFVLEDINLINVL